MTPRFHLPHLDTGQRLDVRGRAGHGARLRCDMRQPRLLVVDDVLGDDDCEALVRIVSWRAARAAHLLDAPSSGAGTAPVSLEGPDVNPYESACRDHVDDRLHALLDWPRDAGRPLRVWHGAGAWPGAGQGLRDAASVDGACVGVVVCWLHVPRRGAHLWLPDAGVSIAARRGTAVFLGAGALAGRARLASAAGSCGPTGRATPVGADAPWIATKCFTRP